MSHTEPTLILQLNQATKRNDVEKVKEIVSCLLLSVQPELSETTALHIAAIHGRNSLINILLQLFHIDSVDNSGNTPLLLAVMNNKPSTVSLLIKNGANIDKHNIFKMTPVHCAIKRKSCKVLKRLLQNGARLDEKNNSGDFPLLTALKKKRKGIFKLLVKHGADINNTNLQNSTALHMVVEKNDLELVKLIADLNVNIQDHNGNTPLHIACSRNYSDVVNLLLKKNSNCNLTNKNGHTAYDEAMLNKFYNLKDIFIQNGCEIPDEEMYVLKKVESFKNLNETENKKVNNNETIFFGEDYNADESIPNELNQLAGEHFNQEIELEQIFSIQNGNDTSILENIHQSIVLPTNIDKKYNKKSKSKLKNKNLANRSKQISDELKTEIFEKEIEQSMKVLLKDCTDIYEYILLAAMSDKLNKKNLEKIEYICARKNPDLNFNLKDFNGDTFLIRAIKRRKLVLFNLLIKYGADVNKTNNEGCTPLHIAVKNKDKKIVQQILDAGANINKITCRFTFPLKIAVNDNLEDMVSLLLKNGSDINLTDNYGNSALHSAVCRNNQKIISILCMSGININLKNKRGFTAIHTAVNKNFTKSVKSLLEFEPDLETTNFKGLTPLDTALYRKNKEIYHILSKLTDKRNFKNESQPKKQIIKQQKFCRKISVLAEDIKHIDNNLAASKTLYKSIKNNNICKRSETKQIKKTNSKRDTDTKKSPNTNIKVKRKLVSFELKTDFEKQIKKSMQGLQANRPDMYKLLLLEAINDNKIDKIKYICQKYCKYLDLNCNLDQKGDTFLITAVKNNNLSAFNALVSHGTDVDHTNNEGYAPIHFAVRNNSIKIVERILEEGGDINKVTTSFDSTLKMSVNFNFVDMVRFLLKNHCDINLTDNCGNSALHNAVCKSNEEMISILCKSGINVNIRNNEDLTAIHMAVENNYTAGVRLLLKFKPDCESKNIFGFTPLYTASHKANNEIYCMLVENNHNYLILDPTIDISKKYFDKLHENLENDFLFGKGLTALYKASLLGSVKKIKRALKNNIDINVKAIGGISALHLAVKSNNTKAVTYLIRKGASLNSETDYYYTPFFQAINDLQKDMIQCLLINGVDTSYKSTNGLTALQVALKRNNTEMIQLLIKTINPNIKDVDINPIHTILHSASYSGNIELMKLLLENGFDVNVKSIDNKTPLQRAVENNQTSAAELLLRNGAGVELEPNSVTTTLNEAVYYGHEDMIKLLVKYGADINGTSSIGVSPLQVAAQTGNEAILELLLDLGAQIDQD